MTTNCVFCTRPEARGKDHPSASRSSDGLRRELPSGRIAVRLQLCFRARLTAILALLLLALSACERRAELYRPPIQRRPYEVVEPKGLGHYVTMNSPSALDHVVSGILPELHDGRWRWTLQEPVLQFRVPRTSGLKFHMDYAVPPVSLQQTGPVKIQILIGACPLGVIEVQKDFVGAYDKEVPPECLTVDRPVLVRMKVDKVWTDAGDQQPRGFILTGAGFVE